MYKKMALYLVIAFVLVGTGYLAWLNHNDFEKAMVDETQGQLLLIAKSEAQSIEKYILDIHQELEILSSNYAIRKSIAERYNQDNNTAYHASLEDSYKDVEKLVDSIYLIDAAGLAVDVSPFKEGIVGEDLSQLPDVRNILANQQAYTSQAFKSSSGAQVIANLHPIFENGKFIGLLRALISIERINSLISHINQGEKGYAFIIDNNATLLSYPDESYIGKSILAVLGQKLPSFVPSELKRITGKMNAGREGVDVFPFLLAGQKPKIVKTLIAFSPVRINSELWSIAVAMDYNAIAAPINRNARDNLVFTGFVLLVFATLSLFFYRAQKEKERLAITAQACNIINKQLHLEIAERKHIERMLHNSLGERKKKH